MSGTVLIFSLLYSLLHIVHVHDCSSHANFPRCQITYGPSSRKIGYGPLATHSSPLLFCPTITSSRRTVPFILHIQYVFQAFLTSCIIPRLL
ncbi:hypothetical protein C8Q80DRAFT_710697 [Daedaleopsis nitida]|nr:hypothetical protein C8Q80DRAFT_710697 [Daedaleopsis nitida]